MHFIPISDRDPDSIYLPHGPALDDHRHAASFIGHCRELVARRSGTSIMLPGTPPATTEGCQPFFDRIPYALGCIGRIGLCAGLCSACLWHEKIRGQPLWRMGMHDRIPCSLLVGAMGYGDRSVHRCIPGGGHCPQGFLKGFPRCNRILHRVSLRDTPETGDMHCDGILSCPESLVIKNHNQIRAVLLNKKKK